MSNNKIFYVLLKDGLVLEIEITSYVNKDNIPFLVKPYFVRHIDGEEIESFINEKKFYEYYYGYEI